MKSWEVDKVFVVLARIADALEGILKEMKDRKENTEEKPQEERPEALLTSDEDPFEVEIYYMSLDQIHRLDPKEKEDQYPNRGEGWYYRPWTRLSQGGNIDRSTKVRLPPVGPFASRHEADEAGTVHGLRLEDAFMQKLRGRVRDAN